MATNNAVNISGSGLVKYDNAGTFSVTTVTQNALIYGGASNALSSLALTNGQLAIGSTGSAPSAATLTQGSGISITNGAGTITIASSSGYSWSIITADQTAAINNAYICNKAGTLTLTLPTTAAVGSIIGVMNMNTATGAKILSANPGQIYLGTSAATANTGYFQSINLGDSMFLVCVVADTTWRAYSVTGNWTVV